MINKNKTLSVGSLIGDLECGVYAIVTDITINKITVYWFGNNIHFNYSDFNKIAFLNTYNIISE